MNQPLWLHQFRFGGQFIHWLWVGQPPTTISLWAGLRKMSFFFFFLFFKLVLQTYQPHFRVCNPSSIFPFYIFGGPNNLVSSASKSNAHNSISSAIIHCAIAIICFNMNSIVPLPLLMFPCTFYTQSPFVSFF
jgi:hypothetical protein